MKRHNWQTICILTLIFTSGLCLAQSGIYNPVYKPHARFVIPVVQQPEFSGTVTNISTNTVFEVSGWSTNIVEFTTVSNGLVSVTNTAPEFAAVDLVTTNTAAAVNTNTFPYADFELFAVDQRTGEVVAMIRSFDNDEAAGLYSERFE